MINKCIRASLAIIFVASTRYAVACPTISTSNAPLLNGNTITNILTPYFSCNKDEPLLEKSPCNLFVARAMSDIYGIDDFKAKTGYLSANQIAQKLVDGFNGWKPIGILLDDDNGACAQALANEGYPVIAALSEKDHGHVALIIPGKLNSRWQGYQSPNSASFLLGKPQLSYIGKPLSFSFGKLKAKQAKYFYHEPLPFVTIQLVVRDGVNEFNSAPVLKPPRN